MSKITISRVVLIGGLAAALGWYGLHSPPPESVSEQAAPASQAAQRKPVASDAHATDVATAARNRPDWPLPADVRLPGIGSSRLADDLESWIASLAAGQDKARGFSARYAPAYALGSRAEQAWMLEQGFPSLEEVAAFDYVRDARDCPSSQCRNPKIAALAADHFIQQMQHDLPPPAQRGADVGELLDEAARSRVMHAYREAGSYAEQVRQCGNAIFAAYLDAEREQSLGYTAQAEANRLFIAACGDPRGGLDPAQVAAAMSLLRNAQGSPCTGRPLLPAFPARDAQLAAQ